MVVKRKPRPITKPIVICFDFIADGQYTTFHVCPSKNDRQRNRWFDEKMRESNRIGRLGEDWDEEDHPLAALEDVIDDGSDCTNVPAMKKWFQKALGCAVAMFYHPEEDS